MVARTGFRGKAPSGARVLPGVVVVKTPTRAPPSRAPVVPQTLPVQANPAETQFPSGLRISSLPEKTRSDAATRTKNVRAGSSGAACRKRVVRSRSERRNAAWSGQLSGAA